MPDTSEPKPREAEEHDAAAAPAELDIEEYHQVADHYLEKLVSLLEAKQETDGKIDVEYSVCDSLNINMIR
jgi:frataxin